MQSIYSFIELLSDDLKQRYISNFIQENGNISDDLWNEIITHMSKNYKNVSNFSETIKILLKESNQSDAHYIKNELNKNGKTILEELQDTLLDLEDILGLDKVLVKRALHTLDTTELIKATYIVSPNVIEYFQSIYPDIDFMGMREKIGNLSVEEAMIANRNVINIINANYSSF